MKQTPTKYQYEQAKETVVAYEKRQRQLKAMEEELAKKLRLFKSIKFKIDKKNREILFAGYIGKENQVKIGKAICSKEDKFEPVIGKLISVKNALGESVEDVVKLVEPVLGYQYVRAAGITASCINTLT